MTQISLEARSAWAGRSVRARQKVVRRFRGLLAEKADWIARDVAGASVSRPAGDVGVAEVLTSEVLPLCAAARFLEREAWYWLRPQRLGWRGRPGWLVGVRSEIRREPVGTVLIIAAGNYPLFLPGVQVLQALVAGNAVVLKPGRGGTTAATWLADLLREAGLPGGVLWVEDETVAAAERWLTPTGSIIGLRRVDKVFLTGSVGSGRAVLARCAETLTPACVELSGCDAVFVLPPEDGQAPHLHAGLMDDGYVERAAKAVAFGLRLNGSQTCIAPRRVFVTPEVRDAFVGALRREIVAGGAKAMDPAVMERVMPLVEAAEHEGATRVCGTWETGATQGEPFVLMGSAEVELTRSDVFAPVTTVIEAEDDAAMLRMDAWCPYALGASVFGPRKRAERFANRVNAGSVCVNDVIVPTADPRLPFGGRGLSGLGETRGAEGLLSMTRIKTVSVSGGVLGWVDRWVGRPHYDRIGEKDAAAFAAYVRVAHGGSLATRLGALPGLWRGLKALSKKQSKQVETQMKTDGHG